MPDDILSSAVHGVARKRGSSRRRMFIRWAKRGTFALVIALVVAMIVRAFIPQPLVVETTSIERGSLEVEIIEDGRTRVRERYIVSAPISGELERIELDAGAQVASGAVLARLRPMQSALLDERTRSEANARLDASSVAERQAVTAIARARLARDAAVREADRARRLEQQAAITTAERERAELAERLAHEDLATAELQRQAAQAERAAARAILVAPASPNASHIVELRAPAAGKILRVHRDSAGPITAGTPLVELADLAGLEVVVDVLSSDAAHIAPGMEVRVSPGGTASIPGVVRVVEPAAFTRVSALGVEEQRVNVIAALTAPPANLGDGFRVDATIITWRGADVVVAPASALFRDRGRWAVYVVVGNKARLQPIEIGHRGRLAVEVTHGLAVGDRVISHPSDRVTDGTAVRPR
ncbi:MAG: HlyD family efflux transporter periplasmic adaptor subunit [Kofleriaceae bacterium]|nr:HlyD family efflux transporter periplasmic adaptor subunit [Kofleriaceae bacterium]